MVIIDNALNGLEYNMRTVILVFLVSSVGSKRKWLFIDTQPILALILPAYLCPADKHFLIF